jgi:hypothetical protein
MAGGTKHMHVSSMAALRADVSGFRFVPEHGRSWKLALAKIVSQLLCEFGIRSPKSALNAFYAFGNIVSKLACRQFIADSFELCDSLAADSNPFAMAKAGHGNALS